MKIFKCFQNKLKKEYDKGYEKGYEKGYKRGIEVIASELNGVVIMHDNIKYGKSHIKE